MMMDKSLRASRFLRPARSLLTTLGLLAAVDFAHAAPPANDNFNQATALAEASHTLTGSNAEATRQSGERVENGHRTIWFRWTAPADVVVTLRTEGTAFEHRFGVYMGAAPDQLNLVAFDDEYYGSRENTISFPAAAGTAFYIVLGSTSTTNTNNDYALSLTTAPMSSVAGLLAPQTSVAKGPVNNAFAQRRVIAGEQWTLVDYNGDATREAGEGDTSERTTWYEWTAPANLLVTLRTEGTRFEPHLRVFVGGSLAGLNRLIDDDNSYDTRFDTSTFPVVQGTTYLISVGSYATTNVNNSIVLNLSSQPLANTGTLFGPAPSSSAAPANDNFLTAQVLTGEHLTAIGYNGDATREAGEGDHGYRTLWYEWTSPADLVVTLRADGSSFDHILTVSTGDAIDKLNAVGYDDDSYAARADTIVFPAPQGTKFRFVIGADAATHRNNYARITLTSTPLSLTGTLFAPAPSPVAAPVNDNFATAQSLQGTSLTAIGFNGGATRQIGEGSYGERTIWYSWTAPITGWVTLTTAGTGFSNRAAVYFGPQLETLNLVASEGYAQSNTVSFAAAAGVTYYFVIGGNTDTHVNFSSQLRLTTTNLPTLGTLYGPDAPIVATPLNDPYGSAKPLASGDFTVIAYNGSATADPEQDAPRSLWYTWTAPASGTASLSMTGTDFNHYLAAYLRNGDSYAGIDDDSGSAGASAGFSISVIKDRQYLFLLGSTSNSYYGSIVFRVDAPGSTPPTNPPGSYPAGRHTTVIPHETTPVRLDVVITTRGRLSGKIWFEGKAYGVSGKFDEAGVYLKTIRRGRLAPLTLRLELSGTGTNAVVSATLTPGTGTAIGGDLNPPSLHSKRNPSPHTGRYTVLLDPATPVVDADLKPPGSGAGTLKVNSSGRAIIAGRTADGARFSSSAYIDANNGLDLYIPLYRKAGHLSGRVTFRNEAATDADGELQLRKPWRPSDKRYSGAFDLEIALSAARYASTQPPLPSVETQARLAQGDLGAVMTVDLPVLTGARIKTGPVNFKFSKGSGLVTGSFLAPGARRGTAVFGAVNQKEGVVRGHFLGVTQAGELKIEEPAIAE